MADTVVSTEDTRTKLQKATRSDLFGRTVIYTAAEKITADNLIAELNLALPAHMVNASQIEYLHNYYRGIQPIQVREKTVRPEICNNITENHAYDIVDFKVGYIFGEPIQYIRRGDDESLTKSIEQLNEFMFSEDKTEIDTELGKWMFKCGTAYRMILSDAPTEEDDCPFELDCLDPRYTFVIYGSGFKHKPLAGVMMVVTPEGDTRYCIYTPTMYFEVVSNSIVKEESHNYGDVPIIEYPANEERLGAFEIVIPLLNAMNLTGSNRMDAIEQFVQAFMIFKNCSMTKEKFAELKDLGALEVADIEGTTQQSDVKMIATQLDQTQTQISKDDIYSMILVICGMPNRNGQNRTTNDTGQAVLLRDGWSAAESRARKTESIFKKSERKFLKIALKIMAENGKSGLKISNVDMKFNRRQNDNMLVKTQGLTAMLTAGIHPLIAITTCGLFNDATDVYTMSKEFLRKWDFVEIPIPDPTKDTLNSNTSNSNVSTPPEIKSEIK